MNFRFELNISTNFQSLDIFHLKNAVLNNIHTFLSIIAIAGVENNIFKDSAL